MLIFRLVIGRCLQNFDNWILVEDDLFRGWTEYTRTRAVPELINGVLQ